MILYLISYDENAASLINIASSSCVGVPPRFVDSNSAARPYWGEQVHIRASICLI